MPSPHTRAGGESLAKRITATRSMTGRAIPDARDHYRANQARVARNWESAASDLAARGNRVRVDSERAHHLQLYADDVRQGLAIPWPSTTQKPTAPAAEPRYWLGACLGCERDVWVHTQRPRVPLCERCRGRR